MFELDVEMAAKLRERRARKNITLEEASQEIGISRRTLGQIENEKILSVRKTVYKKLVDWLVNEKIYKEQQPIIAEENNTKRNCTENIGTVKRGRFGRHLASERRCRDDCS